MLPTSTCILSAVFGLARAAGVPARAHPRRQVPALRVRLVQRLAVAPRVVGRAVRCGGRALQLPAVEAALRIRRRGPHLRKGGRCLLMPRARAFRCKTLEPYVGPSEATSVEIIANCVEPMSTDVEFMLNICRGCVEILSKLC